MEILVLCHRFPFPPNKGEKIRAHAVLSNLSANHTVHVGCFVDNPEDMVHRDALKALVKGECLFLPIGKNDLYLRGLSALAKGDPVTISYFDCPKLRHWVEDLLKTRPIDCAYIFSSAMAPYLFDTAEFDPSRVVFDMVDVDSDKWNQYALNSAGPKAWLYRREASKLLALERRAAQLFGATVLVSPFEAQTFSTLAPESCASVHSVPNGVDTRHFSSTHQFQSPFRADVVPIVMTGAMDYRPNAEGAIWLARKVMPHIWQELPHAHFFAVGARPTRALRARKNSRVTVSGWVDDIRPYIRHAEAVVAPLHMARGVQNKVLEAMAMERPVIATHAASRALNVQDRTHLWIEDEPVKFARAVLDAIRGPSRTAIARNGRLYVEREHDWSRNLAVLDRLLRHAAAREPSPVLPSGGNQKEVVYNLRTGAAAGAGG